MRSRPASGGVCDHCDLLQAIRTALTQWRDHAGHLRVAAAVRADVLKLAATLTHWA
jgi:hypothetical protein